MLNHRKTLALVSQAEGALRVALQSAPPLSRPVVARALSDAVRARSALHYDQPARRRALEARAA